MRVLLTGATGFIGSHLLLALRAAGHEVVAVARKPGRVIPGVRWVTGDFSRDHAPADWASAVTGVDAVVNAVGIIREVPGQTFEALQDKAPRALFDAASRAGVGRLVQISALGCDDAATNRYFTSKRATDRAVEALGGTVLRPSFVWGPGDLSMRFFRMLAALPVLAIVGDGEYKVMPVHVHDLARAVIAAVEGPGSGAPQGSVGIDAVGADAVSFNDLLDALRARMGRRVPALKLHFPVPLVALVARFTDLTGVGAINSDELAMLQRGSTADPGPFLLRFGFAPRGILAGLADEPGADRDRLIAEMDALAPVLRLCVGFIWLATPFVTWFVWPRADSLALLAPTGITGPLATLAIDGTCVLEVLLGLATLAGWRLGLVGLAQIALVVGFSGILTVSSPGLWGHPFGALTKNVPLLAAILAMMATRTAGSAPGGPGRPPPQHPTRQGQ